MSLILDSSATTAWVYMDVASKAIRQVFDIVSDQCLGPFAMAAGGR